MTNWILAIVGALLVLDSLLALIFGKRYMLWGLERMPASYRKFITRLSGLPAKKLLVLKLAEFTTGVLFLVAASGWSAPEAGFAGEKATLRGTFSSTKGCVGVVGGVLLEDFANRCDEAETYVGKLVEVTGYLSRPKDCPPDAQCSSLPTMKLGSIRLVEPKKLRLVPEDVPHSSSFYSPFCPYAYGFAGDEAVQYSGSKSILPVSSSNLSYGGSSILGVSSVSGADPDGDGLYDVLEVFVGVNATEDFSGSLDGFLGINGTYLPSDSEERMYSSMVRPFPYSFRQGLNELSLNFSGVDIYNRGFDGAYSLDVSLCGLSGSSFHNGSSSFNLSYLDHSRFQRPPVEFAGALEYVEDSDGDGLWDYLATEAELDVWKPGNYSLYGEIQYLDAKDGETKAMVSATPVAGYFGRGRHAVVLRFDGASIYSSGMGGGATVGLQAVSEDSGYYSKSFDLSSHNYSEFQRPVFELAGAYSDSGFDSDGNGESDYLVVRAGAKIRKAGDYLIFAGLSDSDGNTVAQFWNGTFFDAGEREVPLYFDGIGISAAGVAGPYVLDVFRVWDPNSSLVYSADPSYSTGPYSPADFERGAELSGALTDDLGVPAAGVSVFLYPGAYSAVSVGNGSYSFRGLRRGNYTLEFAFPSNSSLYGFSPKAVELVSGQNSLDLEFVRSGAVKWKVFGPGGVPADAAVSLGKCSMELNYECVENRGTEAGCYVGNCHYTSSAVVDASGYAVIPKIAPGNYTLNVRPRSPDLKEFDLNVIVLPGENVFNISLEQCGSISGTVKDSAGNPFTDAMVQIAGPETPFSHVCERSGECELGSYTLPCLDPGEYEVRVLFVRGGAHMESPLKKAVVEPGKTVQVDFTLDV